MTAIRPLKQPLERPVRLGVLISGSGTTLQNFIDKIAAGELNAEIPLVIASHEGCGGMARAKRAGLQYSVIARRQFSSVDDFSAAIFEQCRAEKIDLVTLAGFLALIQIPDDFHYRIMNIHPALIPSFCGQGCYGRRVHEAVLQRGVRVSGCTVHFADNEYDHGPIIVQKTVSVLDQDTPETLAARVFEKECEAYPEAIRMFAEARILIRDGRVITV